jgi:hypothetical protein
LNQQVRIAVTSVLQTSAGRMIFGRYEAQARPVTQEEPVASHKGARD